MTSFNDSSAPRGLVCQNGHAIDDGYFECPCCGAYRPPGCVTPGMTSAQQMAAIRAACRLDAEAVQMMRDLGMPAQEVAALMADAKRRGHEAARAAALPGGVR